MSDNTARVGCMMPFAAAPEGRQGVLAGGAVASTGQSKKATGGSEGRALGEPWGCKTPGEAMAWLRGYEAAKAQALVLAENERAFNLAVGEIDAAYGAQGVVTAIKVMEPNP